MLPGGPKRQAAFRGLGKLLVGIGVFGAIFLLAGELFLRLVFWEGDSFSRHYGPIVQRFERDFKFNRFDGPSRGPEPPGPKLPDNVRIVIQGDSITWGQGVRNEEQLFSSRLLARLRETDMPVDMAVLARPGREIDEHLQQLQKWGQELRPDVIIYQWYINDMELEKQDRPRTDRIWRHVFFYPILQQHSYLWFFLDFSLDTLLPSGTIPYESYARYIADHFNEGSAGWSTFERYFSEWAKLAKELTPHVIVALYPYMSLKDGFPPAIRPEVVDIHTRMMSLCRTNNVLCVDLSASLVKFEDARAMRATAFDDHPSAEVHRVMAEELSEVIGAGMDHPL